MLVIFNESLNFRQWHQSVIGFKHIVRTRVGHRNIYFLRPDPSLNREFESVWICCPDPYFSVLFDHHGARKIYATSNTANRRSQEIKASYIESKLGCVIVNGIVVRKGSSGVSISIPD